MSQWIGMLVLFRQFWAAIEAFALLCCRWSLLYLTLAMLCSPTDVRNWITHADDFAVAYIALTSQLYQLANRYVPTHQQRLEHKQMAGVCLPGCCRQRNCTL